MNDQPQTPPTFPEENLEDVTLDIVRDYLLKTYKLDPDKLDILMAGACSGIQKAMSEANRQLDLGNRVLMGNAVHSMKGALLNMGLNGWANFARLIEASAKKNEDLDYQPLLQKLAKGLNNLLEAEMKTEER